ncbi:MAG: MCE family protein [Ignavibacteriae bacterium]|nr:MCE family protein [Ignavibacteriota bacterium]
MAKVDTSPTGRTTWRNLRTGLLFVGGVIIAATLGLIIGKNTNLLTTHDTAHLFVMDIKGMSEGNMVAIGGKKIGVVKSMDFAKRGDTTGVVVTLDITSEHFKLITKDSKAILKALGVLGDAYVDIALGSSDEFLEDGGYLEAVASPGMDELIKSAIETMSTIQDISLTISKGEGTFGKLVRSNELNEKLLKAAGNLEAITNSIVRGQGLAGRLINDKQLAGRVSDILDNLAEVSSSIRSGKGSLGKFIVDESFYDRLSAITHRADSLFVRINNPNTTLGKLTRDAELYKHLDHSIISLDSLLMDFKENPSRYVKVSVF